MKPNHTWRDAVAAAGQLTPTQRVLMLLLVRLPLAPADTLRALSAASGPAAMYRHLNELSERGLLAPFMAKQEQGRAAALYYLTDLGVAALCIAVGAEPGAVARHFQLRYWDLLQLVPTLPQLVAEYRLLAQVADTTDGWPTLLLWQRPWLPPTWRVRSRHLPPLVDMESEAGRVRALLLADAGFYPLSVYRRLLRYLAERARQGIATPPLLIASPNELRTSGWRAALRRTLDDVGAAPNVTLSGPGGAELGDAVMELATDVETDAGTLGRAPRFPQFRPRAPERPLPSFAGWAEAMRHRLTLRAELGIKALQLTRADREVLDLLAQHPFLSANDVASFLFRSVRCIRRVLRHFVAIGLALDVERRYGRRKSYELSLTGLQLAAMQAGLTLAASVSQLGFAGGGAGHEIGPRRDLWLKFTHTRKADEAVALLARDGGVEVVTWHSAQAALQGKRFRPDGYLVVGDGRHRAGFFFEFDTGKASMADYRQKLGTIFDFFGRSHWRHRYQSAPGFVFVTEQQPAEARFWRATAEMVSAYSFPLPIFSTTMAQLKASGVRSPIWRHSPVPSEPRIALLGSATSQAMRRPAALLTSDERNYQ